MLFGCCVLFVVIVVCSLFGVHRSLFVVGLLIVVFCLLCLLLLVHWCVVCCSLLVVCCLWFGWCSLCASFGCCVLFVVCLLFVVC